MAWCLEGGHSDSFGIAVRDGSTWHARLDLRLGLVAAMEAWRARTVEERLGGRLFGVLLSEGPFSPSVLASA